MARNKKQTSKPRLIKHDDAIKTIRLPRPLVAEIDSVRGEIEFTVWVRETLERVLVSHEEQAIRDVEKYMNRRGVTIEMLSARKPS